MLDRNGRPWLLEINRTPSYERACRILLLVGRATRCSEEAGQARPLLLGSPTAPLHYPSTYRDGAVLPRPLVPQPASSSIAVAQIGRQQPAGVRR